jgi:hypothetical protein
MPLNSAGIFLRQAGREAIMDNARNTGPDTILTEIRQESAEDADVAERILDWSKRYFAPRLNPGSIRFEFRRTPTGFHPINITSEGKLYLQMTNIGDMIRSKHDLPEFNRRLSAIAGVTDNPDFPWIQLRSLANDETLNEFLQLMEWLIQRLRKF